MTEQTIVAEIVPVPTTLSWRDDIEGYVPKSKAFSD